MTAWYNEIDKKKAAWLRELIARGIVCPGDVDTRDIRDVCPSDLRGYTQCHFFAGIGIWSYALRRGGVPDRKPIWTGSCPCGPFSEAGRRNGFDDERHLWPAWHHLIRVCRPDTVLGEQVASRDGLAWLDLVQADMEGEVYSFGAVDLCAAGVGAPNRRQRLLFVANANGRQLQGLADGKGCWGHRSPPGWVKGDGEPQSGGIVRGLADASGAGSLPASQPRIHRGEESPGPRDAELERLCSLGDPDSAGHEIRVRIGGYDAIEVGEAERQAAIEAGIVRGWWSDARFIKCFDPEGPKYRPIEPSTFPLADGAAARVLRLRGYGDGINAEATAEFIRAAQVGE